MNKLYINQQEMFVGKLVAYVYKQQLLLNNANGGSLNIVSELSVDVEFWCQQ